MFASLAALRESVTNFQEKFRHSVLSGLLVQYEKRLANKQASIGKWMSKSEGMTSEVRGSMYTECVPSDSNLLSLALSLSLVLDCESLTAQVGLLRVEEDG